MISRFAVLPIFWAAHHQPLFPYLHDAVNETGFTREKKGPGVAAFES
jgi:hypothetical protein